MNYLEIEPLDLKIENSNYTRRCLIKRIDDNTQLDQTELWFQFDKSIVPPEDDDCDSYLLSIIMLAMQEKRNIYIRGKVSKYLLSNLVEYQAAWNKWLPNIYSCINISVESLRDDAVIVAGALCAFSGGVDATFSVWRHTQNKCSYRTQKINLCAMVHGFDIPLSDESGFYNARKKAEQTLSDVQLNLLPIVTNYREVVKVSWEHNFSCALVATVSNFKNVAGTCIIGSSEPYDSLVIPWGSSPITDHLLSSGNFNVIHDGASHSRTEKVKEIADWKVGIENLRVCWQGIQKGENCGQCEKCLRTKLNFLATGNPIPICFSNSNIIKDMEKVVLKNEGVRAEWRQIYEYSKKNNIREPWIKQLPKIIEKKKNHLMNIIDTMLPNESNRRNFVKKMIRKMRRLSSISLLNIG